MKSIFISYSHKDEEEKKKVEEHLRIFEKYSNEIKGWSDSDLKCGDEINPEIIKAIERADAAVLIVSTNFLNSDFIREEEVPRLFERRAKEGISVFPLIVKSCNWQVVPQISAHLIRPKDAKPLNSYKGDNKEKILADFAKEVNEVVTSDNSSTYDIETKSSLESVIVESKHIVQQLFDFFQKFEGFNFIPPNTLSNLYPFHDEKEVAFHYETFTLYTLNPELYWFFENVKIDKDRIEISKELVVSLERASVEDYEDKVEYVINRLNQNLVFYIESYRDPNKARLKLAGGIFGYDLNYPFPYLDNNSVTFQIQKDYHAKSCQCIQCLYHDLKFLQAYEYIDATMGNEEDYDLKTGYVAYNLASNNYKDAYLIYRYLREKYRQQNSLKYFVASYNLKYLYYDIKGNYSLKDKESILDYIREIDLDQIICEIKENVDADVHRIIIEIKEEKLISKTRYRVDDLFAQIIEIRDVYENEGSFSGPNYVRQLLSQMASLFGYYEWNYLIGNKYGNITGILSKIFEALLISHKIEKYRGHLKEFNGFHILNAILFISPKKLQKIFSINNINQIVTTQDCLNELLEIFNNFLQNNHEKSIFGGFTAKEEFFQYTKSFDAKQKVAEIFSNCLFLLSKTALQKNNQTDTLVSNLINFLRFNSSNLFFNSNNELKFFINAKKELFTSEQLEELIELWLNKAYLRNTNLPKTISKILIERAQFRISDSLADMIILKIANKKSCSDFHHLIYLSKVVTNEKQKLISDFFNDYLKKNSISSLIFLDLYLQELVSLENEEIFKKFVNQSISREVKEMLSSPIEQEHKNYTYLNFISAVYRLGIDRRYILTLIPKDVKISPYCEWLLKFDFYEYDYDKFQLDWLLFNKKSETFFKQFSKESRIKVKLEKYLSMEYNSELGDIYLKFFFRN